MRKIALLILVFLSSALMLIGGTNKGHQYNNDLSIIRTQVSLEANNIRTRVWNTGVFNQNIGTPNTAGFEWPKGSGKSAIYTSGLTLAAYINNQFRMASAFYLGEYVPGYCVNGTLHTNMTFKLYRVTRGDNWNTNPDWANWGLMVPYGAPYNDVNNSGYYEPAIDTPGVKGAAQTVFICLTDADQTSHTSEGFGGGTPPLFAEVHLTAWCYDNAGYGDMQFLKWVVINKNTSAWDSTLISLVSDPDLGDPNDDYIGCDSTRNLGFCYNSDNQDGTGAGNSYGVNPPAVGIMFLSCSGSNAELSSFVPVGRSSSPQVLCEREPNNPLQAYNFMQGFKNDRTPWINVHTLQTTKFCYSHPGWMEYDGRIENCGGSLGGPIVPSPAGDRRFVMNYKPANQRLAPLDSQVIVAAQLIGRGSSNLNSIDILLLKADAAKYLCQNGFVIGINPISTEIPNKFNLYQNYPNPFNPVTKIKFDIPPVVTTRRVVSVQLVIYDALGREITTLVNEQLRPGTYEVEWPARTGGNGLNYPSGVYFYKLQTGAYTETKKMVLLK